MSRIQVDSTFKLIYLIDKKNKGAIYDFYKYNTNCKNKTQN